MNRLLLLCLLACIHVCAYGNPPLLHPATTPGSVSHLLIDTISPTIQCPPNDTIVLGVGKCDTAFNYTVEASDDQPNFILIQLSGLASGSSFPVGTFVNSYLVTDLAGNTATCSFSITVVEAGGPTLFCQDLIEVELGQNCAASVDPEDLLEAPYGCLDDLEIAIDKIPPYGNGPWVPANLGITDLGKTYQARVTDPGSNASCWGNLKVIDPAPVIQCSNLTVHCAIDNLTPSFLHDSLGIAAGMPVASDNCPGFSLTYIDIAENLPCNPLTSISGTVSRVWTATDTSGNKSSCQQTIVRQRSFSDIKFPGADTASCTDKTNFDLTGTPYVSVGDYRFSLWPTSYCEFEIQYQDTLQTAYCGSSGRYVRTWQVFDLCQPISPDNPLTGQQILDFIDELSPTVACDSSLTVVADATDCLIALDIPDISFSDNCSPITTVLAHWPSGMGQDTMTIAVTGFDTVAVFDEIKDFPARTTTITYEVTDGCGKTGTCQTLVTIWDTDPPVADCIPFFTVTLDAGGEFSLGADTLDQSSKDSCSEVLSFKMRRVVPSTACQPGDQFDDAVPFCCADIGDTIELTRRVYDILTPDGPVAPDYGQNQFSDCIVKVVVFDTLPLSCIAPPDMELSCTTFDLQSSNLGDPIYTCQVDSASVSLNTILYDSTCAEGLVTRVFHVFDKAGNSATCFQQITIAHVQDYYIKFPDDVILTQCDSLNTFGVPEFSKNGCEVLEATYKDELFSIVPDACYKIERTWTIWNRCRYDSTIAPIVVPNPTPLNPPNASANLPGPIVSPAGTAAPWEPTLVKIGFLDSAPSSYADFWSADANAYQYKQIIKVIDTQKPAVSNCPSAPVAVNDTTTNDSLLWNQAYWYDPATDQHDLCEGTPDLSITATDACSGKNINISFLLFLNLDGNNTQETVINSNNVPAPGTVNFDNFSLPNYAGGTSSVFDGRAVSPALIYRWALHQEVNGNNITASVQWKTALQLPTPDMPFGTPGIAPQLPHGTHKIRWIITDLCGNETTCEYNFTVRDSKAPAVTCKSAAPDVEMPATGAIGVATSQYLESASDNCTPAAGLKYGLRKAGSGTGFPTAPGGAPQDSVHFACADLGPQTLELWARDVAGNTSSCTISINVTDADSSCALHYATVAGNVFVVSTNLSLAATHPLAQAVNQSTQSDTQGDFEFLKMVPFGSDYMLTPQNNNNPLNGVSTFDLLLISKHILGLETLNSPYKIIAADANHSNTVTTFDVVEIRKLILGLHTEFPDNTSWRFVDADFVFPDPANPFATAFPEKITRTDIPADQLEDNFIAVKIGDVNASALPDNFSDAEERGKDCLFFDVKNRTVEAGEQFTVDFKAAEQVLGYQFTLNTNGLEITNLLPGEHLSASNFAVLDDALTVAAENGAGEFAVTFRAQKPGKLSDLISISSRITRAEAYAEQRQNKHDSNDPNAPSLLSVALRFDDGAVAQPGFELYQNRPNPFSDKTLIGFNLPEASDATLQVLDETGRVLYNQTGHYSRGYNVVSIAHHLLDASGVLYYQLTTPAGSAVRKMVLLKG